MHIPKELSSISWQVSEPEYRADTALSYSILSRFEREGFNRLPHLFDSFSSQALLEGSMVDCLITGSPEEFNSLYYIADLPPVGEKEKQIAQVLYDQCHSSYPLFSLIPSEVIIGVANDMEFQKNWRDATRVTALTERIGSYYDLKVQAAGKTVVSSYTYNKVAAMVNALRTSISTKGYFADNDSLSPVRRYYQLKFKAKFHDICYRCMADLLVVDYEDKVIYPIDLKTSGHHEWDFQDSFLQWHYVIQARLYWRIIKANLMADPYFKDFTLADYRFIVVNKESLTPLVWKFPLTQATGTLVSSDGKEFRDPFAIGKELQGYLNLRPKVPNGILEDGSNIITCLERSKEPNK